MRKLMMVGALLLLGLTQSGYAGKVMKISIANQTFEPLLLYISNVRCMQGGDYSPYQFDAKILEPGATLSANVEDKNSGMSCFEFEKKFTINIAGEIPRALTLTYKQPDFSHKVCSSVKSSRLPFTDFGPNRFMGSKTCEDNDGSKSDPAVITYTVKYGGDVGPTVRVSVDNEKSAKPVHLIGGESGYSPQAVSGQPSPYSGNGPTQVSVVPARGSAAIADYYPYRYDPAQNTLGYIRYGIDDQTYCELEYTWGPGIIWGPGEKECKVDVKSVYNSERGAIGCEKVQSRNGGTNCDATLVVDTSNYQTRSSAVRVYNGSGSFNATRTAYAPSPDDMHRYDPETSPAESIAAGETSSFKYTQSDGMQPSIDYQLADGMSCKLLYNHLVTPQQECAASVENNSTDPVREMGCTKDSKLENSQCAMDFTLNLGAYKPRTINVDINNAAEKDGQLAKLKLKSVEPSDKSNYSSYPPAEITEPQTEFAYKLAGGEDAGQPGAVEYTYTPDPQRPDDYIYCKINYQWGFDPQSETKGCDVKAVSGRVGHPNRELKCGVSNVKMDGQSCRAQVEVVEGDQPPPRYYYVTIKNKSPYPLKRDSYIPADTGSNYSPAPSPEIKGNSMDNKFTYIANHVAGLFSVKYLQTNSQNQTRGCQFNYGWKQENGALGCVATMDKIEGQWAASCQVCGTPVYNPTDQSCTIVFGSGGC